MPRAPFHSRLPPVRVLAVVVLAIAGTLVGCGKDKIVEPPLRRPGPYPIIFTPYNVLDALRIAYQLRDSIEINLLYDDNYQGSSVDPADPLAATLTFGKYDEVRHVAKLAHTKIFSISLVMANGLQRFTDPSDPPGWATINNPFSTLEITDSVTTYQVNFSAESTQFKFIPHMPDPSSPTDTTWKMVRWTEVKN